MHERLYTIIVYTLFYTNTNLKYNYYYSQISNSIIAIKTTDIVNILESKELFVQCPYSLE